MSRELLQVTELNDWHDLTYIPLNADEVKQEEEAGGFCRHPGETGQ